MTWTPTPPTGRFALNSQSYQFVKASLSGGDEVYQWSINGVAGAGGNTSAPVLGTPTTNYPNGTPPAAGTPGSSFIWPWQTNDILIHKASLVLLPPAAGSEYLVEPYLPGYSFLMIGNNAWGDCMGFLGAGEITREFDFGDGGFFFPGSFNMWDTSYIDLHGGGKAGLTGNVMMNLFYEILP